MHSFAEGIGENPTRAIVVLAGFAGKLREDPVVDFLILDNPETLGLDCLGDYSIVFKFLLKTHPLKRWPLKRSPQWRELLRRITDSTNWESYFRLLNAPSTTAG